MNNVDELKIGKNESDLSVSFYIQSGIRIALAEISFFPEDGAKDFIENSHLDKEQKEKLLQILQTSDKLYFFNRLNVPREMREQGIGAKLLNALKDFLDEKNAFLINTANAYGDMNQDDLIKYYQKHGFTLIDKEGGLVYHPQLKNNQEFDISHTKEKIKTKVRN